MNLELHLSRFFACSGCGYLILFDFLMLFGCSIVRCCFGQTRMGSRCLVAHLLLPGFVRLYPHRRGFIDCTRQDLRHNRRFCTNMGLFLPLWRSKGYPWHNLLLSFYKFHQSIEMGRTKDIRKSSNKSKYSLTVVDKCHLRTSFRVKDIGRDLHSALLICRMRLCHLYKFHSRIYMIFIKIRKMGRPRLVGS